MYEAWYGNCTWSISETALEDGAGVLSLVSGDCNAGRMGDWGPGYIPARRLEPVSRDGGITTGLSTGLVRETGVGSIRSRLAYRGAVDSRCSRGDSGLGRLARRGGIGTRTVCLICRGSWSGSSDSSIMLMSMTMGRRVDGETGLRWEREREREREKERDRRALPCLSPRRGPSMPTILVGERECDLERRDRELPICIIRGGDLDGVRREGAGTTIICTGECDLERRDGDGVPPTCTIRVGECDLDLERRDLDVVPPISITRGDLDLAWRLRDGASSMCTTTGAGDLDRDQDRRVCTGLSCIIPGERGEPEREPMEIIRGRPACCDSSTGGSGCLCSKDTLPSRLRSLT